MTTAPYPTVYADPSKDFPQLGGMSVSISLAAAAAVAEDATRSTQPDDTKGSTR